MAYSPTNSFNPTDIVDADLLQENLDEIKEYLNGGIVAGDIDSKSEWIRSNHIVRGRFNPLNGQMRFVSGLTAGKNYSILSNDLSFLPDAPTAMNSPSTPTLVYQPNCSFDFYLPQDAYCLFQFYGNPLTVSLPTTGTLLDQQVWRVCVDDVEETETEVKTQWIATSNADENSYLQQFWAGELAAGVHTISLKGYAEAPYTLLVAWGLSLETWYKSS